MSARSRLLLALGIVFVLYVFHVRLKTTKIFRNDTWNPREETGQFWSECALMIARRTVPRRSPEECSAGSNWRRDYCTARGFFYWMSRPPALTPAPDATSGNT